MTIEQVQELALWEPLVGAVAFIAFSIDPDAFTLVWVSFVVGWLARSWLIPQAVKDWAHEFADRVESRW